MSWSTRLLVASVAIPTIIAITLLPLRWCAGVLYVVGCLSIVEFCNLRNAILKDQSNVLDSLAVPIHILYWTVYCVHLVSPETPLLRIFRVTWIFGVLSVWDLLVQERSGATVKSRLTRWALDLIPCLYLCESIAGAFRYFAQNGPSAFLFTMSATWFADGGALLAGWTARDDPTAERPFPKLSPNKTIRGYLAMCPAAILSTLLVRCVGKLLGSRHPDFFVNGASALQLCFLASTCALLGSLGDLAESALKRVAETKDSGVLFGPHGGILDRLDALYPVWLIFGASV